MNKKMTLEKAILKALEKENEVFVAPKFCNRVRLIYGKICMDGTILRELRRNRAKGKLNYTIVDHNRSIYKKEPLNAL